MVENGIDLNQKEFHDLLFLQSPFGMVITDAKSYTLDANHRACEILGYSKEQLIGLRGKDIIHPDDISKISTATLYDLLKEKNEITIERRYKRADGSYLFAEVCIKLIQKTDNYLIIFQDISEQKRTKGALKASEEKYRSIFENAGDAIFFLEAEGENAGKIIDTNTAAAVMHGYSREELLTMHINDLNVDTEVENMPDRIKKLLSGEWLYTQILHQRKDSSQFPVSVSAGMFEFEGKKYILAFDRDISELNNAEQEKRELQTQLFRTQKLEAIGTLAGGIAHDFNNILSGIMGSSQLAEINIDQPKKLRKNLNQILKATTRAADLVRHILTFSRDYEYEKQPLKVYLVLSEALKLLRSTIPSTIEIVEKIESKATILADYTQIHQVAMNLCINAYQSILEDSGIITTRLKETTISPTKNMSKLDILPGEYLVLEVEDTGCGMEKDVIEKVFDPYFTTKEKNKGTGLGLSTVHGIIKNHNGFIDVKSTPGKGTIFSLFFPITDESISFDHVEIKTNPLPTGDENIMIVDDEDSILQSTKGFLEDHGYKVYTFTNGLDAITAFKKDANQFDLIIADITMPQLAGDIMSIEMLKLNPDLPIILCSGNLEKVSDDLVSRIGVTKAIAKPLDMRSLMVIIRDALDK